MNVNIFQFSETEVDAYLMKYAFDDMGLQSTCYRFDELDSAKMWLEQVAKEPPESHPHAFLIDMDNPYFRLLWLKLITEIRKHMAFDPYPILLWSLAWDDPAHQFRSWQSTWGMGGFYDKPFSAHEMKDFVHDRMVQFSCCYLEAK